MCTSETPQTTNFLIGTTRKRGTSIYTSTTQNVHDSRCTSSYFFDWLKKSNYIPFIGRSELLQQNKF